MIVTMEIPADSRRMIEQHAEASARAGEAIADAVAVTVAVGAERIREGLMRHEFGLTMRHPGSGLAASVDGWMIDEQLAIGALGVPANSPAAAYAAMLNYGGVIRPKSAKALAVPVSHEAKQYSSPRDMPGLVFAKNAAGKAFLGRSSRTGFDVHWLLLASVTIPPYAWFDQGVAAAEGDMTDAFADVIGEYTGEWN